MALYKLVQERVLVPYYYLASNGMEAKHDTDSNVLAVDERGNSKSAIATLERTQGRIIYQDQADFDSLSEEEQANAFYTFDEAALNRYLDKGAIEEVTGSGATPAASEAPANQEDGDEDKKPANGRRKNKS